MHKIGSVVKLLLDPVLQGYNAILHSVLLQLIRLTVAVTIWELLRIYNGNLEGKEQEI
jgi:hypothetical protein